MHYETQLQAGETGYVRLSDLRLLLAPKKARLFVERKFYERPLPYGARVCCRAGRAGGGGAYYAIYLHDANYVKNSIRRTTQAGRGDTVEIIMVYAVKPGSHQEPRATAPLLFFG